MSRARRIAATALFCLAVASAALAGVAAGQEDVTLTITVVDSDGDPVDDADVTASWDGGQDGDQTRSNGQVLIDVPEGENVTITVDHLEYVRNEPYEIEDVSGGDVEVPVVRSGTATIDVVDENGPVDQAIVRLRQDGDLVVNTRTDGDGHFESDQIEQDTYQLTVYREGYARNRTDLTVDGDVEQTLEIEETSAVLTVTVADDHFEPAEPVREASVSVGDIGTVQTLAGGEATISVPVNDRYDVSVSKDGYETNETSVRVDESELQANLTIQRTPAVNLSAGNQRVVVGESVRVTAVDEYGEPIEGVTITRDGEEVGPTNADGALSVPIESAGEHEIGAVSDDLREPVMVTGVGTDDEEEEPTPSADTTPTEENGPGFSALAALVALLGTGLLVRRRRR